MYIQTRRDRVLKVLDDVIAEHMDLAKFAPLIEAAGKHANLKAGADGSHSQLDLIRNYAKANPHDPLVEAARANNLLSEAGGETWIAAGNISLSSFYWWAVGGGLAFPGVIPLAFLFGGKGHDWKAWSTFVSVVAGSFVIDPKVIANFPEFHLEKTPIGWVKKGPCNFSLSEGGVGPAGGVNMQLWSTSGIYWGSVGGIAPGIGGVSISGQLDLVWQGF